MRKPILYTLTLLLSATAGAWDDFVAQEEEGDFARCHTYGAEVTVAGGRPSYRIWGMCWTFHGDNLRAISGDRRPESTFANEHLLRTFKWEGVANYDGHQRLAQETLRITVIDPQSQRSTDAGRATTEFRCIGDPWLEAGEHQCSVTAYTRTPDLDPLLEKQLYGRNATATTPRSAELPATLRDTLRDQHARFLARDQGIRQSPAESRTSRDDRDALAIRSGRPADAPTFQSKAYDPVAAEYAQLAGNGGIESGQCRRGYLTRLAGPTDFVCAFPEARKRSARENAEASKNRATSPPRTVNCISGFVHRSAFVGDVVCVTPAARAQVQQENRLAASRRAP